MNMEWGLKYPPPRELYAQELLRGRRHRLLVHGVVGVPEQDVREAGFQEVHGEEWRFLNDLDKNNGVQNQNRCQGDGIGRFVGSFLIKTPSRFPWLQFNASCRLHFKEWKIPETNPQQALQIKRAVWLKHKQSLAHFPVITWLRTKLRRNSVYFKYFPYSFSPERENSSVLSTEPNHSTRRTITLLLHLVQNNEVDH